MLSWLLLLLLHWWLLLDLKLLGHSENHTLVLITLCTKVLLLTTKFLAQFGVYIRALADGALDTNELVICLFLELFDPLKLQSEVLGRLGLCLFVVKRVAGQ